MKIFNRDLSQGSISIRQGAECSEYRWLKVPEQSSYVAVDADTYAHSVLRYAQAMRAVDPAIHLIAVGAGGDCT